MKEVLDQLVQGFIAALVLIPLAYVEIVTLGHQPPDSVFAGLAGAIIGFYFRGVIIRTMNGVGGSHARRTDGM